MHTRRISRRAFTAASATALWATSATAQSTPVSEEESIETLQDDIYSERDWDDNRSGTINLSGFTYRDIDGDGEYSMGDRPFFGSNIQMVTPDGRTYIQKSNRNGFSNFSASRSSDAAINMPGEYVFTSVPPKGWHITSGNQVQSVTVTEKNGSIGGWVMDQLPPPVGIAPDLVIQGNAHALLNAFEDTELIAISPEGEQILIELESDGSFTLPVTAGDWQIGGASGAVPARLVPVGVHPVVISSLSSSYTEEDRAGSITVGFDDITTGSTLRKVPNGYGGLHWSGLNAISNLFSSGGEGYTNNTQSGEYLTYSSSGHPVIISNEDGFDFVGAYFGVAWPAAEGEIIRARAFQGDRLISEDSFRGSSYGSVYFSANYRDITRLELTTDHFWQFVTDDMEFIVPN